jgi:hypothetical protein
VGLESGNQQCGKVGQAAEEEAGDGVHPFWVAVRRKAHRCRRSMVACGRSEGLMASGQRRGRGRR